VFSEDEVTEAEEEEAVLETRVTRVVLLEATTADDEDATTADDVVLTTADEDVVLTTAGEDATAEDDATVEDATETTSTTAEELPDEPKSADTGVAPGKKEVGMVGIGMLAVKANGVAKSWAMVEAL